MCTMILHQAKIEGCGKGRLQEWFELRGVNVAYDCPFHIRLEHALNIDFINEAEGPSAQVAVDLTPESARELAKAILATLEHAEADGWLSETGEHSHAHGPSGTRARALSSGRTGTADQNGTCYAAPRRTDDDTARA